MHSDVAFPENLPLIFTSYRIILQMLLAHLGDYKCHSCSTLKLHWRLLFLIALY